MRAMEYALDNLPLKDDLLKSARFTKFQDSKNASFSQIQYFVKVSACVLLCIHVH